MTIWVYAYEEIEAVNKRRVYKFEEGVWSLDRELHSGGAAPDSSPGAMRFHGVDNPGMGGDGHQYIAADVIGAFYRASVASAFTQIVIPGTTSLLGGGTVPSTASMLTVYAEGTQYDFGSTAVLGGWDSNDDSPIVYVVQNNQTILPYHTGGFVDPAFELLDAVPTAKKVYALALINTAQYTQAEPHSQLWIAGETSTGGGFVAEATYAVEGEEPPLPVIRWYDRTPGAFSSPVRSILAFHDDNSDDSTLTIWALADQTTNQLQRFTRSGGWAYAGDTPIESDNFTHLAAFIGTGTQTPTPDHPGHQCVADEDTDIWLASENTEKVAHWDTDHFDVYTPDVVGVGDVSNGLFKFGNRDPTVPAEELWSMLDGAESPNIIQQATAPNTWNGYTLELDGSAVMLGGYAYPLGEEPPEPSDEGGGDLAGGPRFRVGFDPDRNSGPRQEDGSLQSDLQIVTGVQNVAQFDGGTLED